MSIVFFSWVLILLTSCQESPPQTIALKTEKAEATCENEEKLQKKLEEDLSKQELPESLMTDQGGCSVE